MKKLAIITSHPVQYNAPLFKMLHKRNRISIKVFYTWSQSASGKKYDPGFGQDVQWDIPLLNVYDYCFVNNVAAEPGSHHFKGINNPTLIKEIEGWNADAVMVYGWSFKSHLKAMRYFKGRVPVLFRGDSTLLDEQSFLKKIARRAILGFVYRHADIALYAGKANKAYFKTHGFKESQLIFMPHAVENSRFACTKNIAEQARDFRERLSICQEATVLLFAGKLEPKKLPLMLAEVFEMLNNENCYLLFAGSGVQENDLKQKFGSNERIKFLGFQNQQNMPLVYAACDVFILPSKGPGETWGLSINEAMAAGKAIIASTACGAVYDLIQNNVNGFVVEKGNAASLLQAVKLCAGNKNLADEMGRKSLEIISAFSFEEDCKAVEQAVLQEHKPNRP